MWVVAGTRCAFETQDSTMIFFFFLFLFCNNCQGWDIAFVLFNLSLKEIEVCTQNEFSAC